MTNPGACSTEYISDDTYTSLTLWAPYCFIILGSCFFFFVELSNISADNANWKEMPAKEVFHKLHIPILIGFIDLQTTVVVCFCNRRRIVRLGGALSMLAILCLFYVIKIFLELFSTDEPITLYHIVDLSRWITATISYFVFSAFN
jgi:hypothetical protein